jgi:hypothetical protein
MLLILLQITNLIKQARSSCAYTPIAQSTKQLEKLIDTGQISLF